MHGSQWARSLRGLVVVLSDGGLSGSSAMPLGIHSWKSGKALRELVCCLTARPCAVLPDRVVSVFRFVLYLEVDRVKEVVLYLLLK